MSLTGGGLKLIDRVPWRVFCVWRADDPYAIGVGLFACWLALLLTARTDERASAARRYGAPYRLEIVTGLAALLVLALPAEPLHAGFTSGRFVPVTALFATLLPQGAIVGRRRFWLVPAFLFALLYPLRLGAAWRRFDRNASSVARLMRAVPRGSSVLTLLRGGDASDPALEAETTPYAQFHAWPVVLAGGFDSFLQDQLPGVKRADAPAAPPAPFRLDERATWFQFILTRNENPPYSLLGPGGANLASLQGVDGEWRLYKVSAR
jgi:hypothetical protein